MNKQLIRFRDNEGNVTHLRQNTRYSINELEEEFKKEAKLDPHLSKLTDLKMEFFEWGIRKQFFLLVDESVITGD